MGVPGSARAGTVQQHEMSPAVREAAAEMLPSAPELARGMTDHIFATVPELAARSGDDALREETRASCEANIDQSLRLLRLGASPEGLVVPLEAAEFVRGLVIRGITLAVLLRSYRVGQAWFWERWSQALRDRISDPVDVAAAQDQTLAFTFAYIDGISDVLVGEYGTEHERLMRGAAQLRAETVRTI